MLKSKTWILYLLIITSLFSLNNNSIFASEKPKIALVLGAGSARGISHIGVIRAFEENGIPIDLIVSASMGSVVGGLYSSGFSVENIAQIVSLIDLSQLFDIYMPIDGGLLDTNRFLVFMDKLLIGKEFSDLAIPLYTVSVKLGNGEEVVFSEGKVSKAMQASLSIPGLFAPALVGEEQYVDGGLKNRVPADVAKRLGADVAIAVNVSQDNYDIKQGNIVNNLRLSLQAILDGYVEIKTAEADIILCPELSMDSTLDYKNVEYFFDKGYLVAMENLEKIKEIILEHDPNYEFIPYKQMGFTNKELTQMLKEAEIAAIKHPSRFTVKPEFIYDSDYNFPKFGLKFTNGPLKEYGLGYRYGFNSRQGGHEVFAYRGTEKTGFLDVYLRLNKNLKKPVWGFTFTSPELNNVVLSTSYVSQGIRSWRITAKNDRVLTREKFSLGLFCGVNGIRAENADASILDKTMAILAPELRVYPWGNDCFYLGYVNVCPYVLTEIALETMLNRFALKPTLKIGLGSDTGFFGFFRGDMFIGLQASKGEKTKLRFEIKVNN